MQSRGTCVLYYANFSIRCATTGMIAPTSGEAVINGMSIRNQMGRIRQNLGVCPQFDILWPDISVKEHLELYAAIKGYSYKDTRQVVLTAAHDVGETSWSHATGTICTSHDCSRLSPLSIISSYTSGCDGVDMVLLSCDRESMTTSMQG